MLENHNFSRHVFCLEPCAVPGVNLFNLHLLSESSYWGSGGKIDVVTKDGIDFVFFQLPELCIFW